MNLMEIDRRAVLFGTVTAFTSGFLRSSPACAVAPDGIAFVAAAKRRDDAYSIVLLSADGLVVREIALTARGHDVAVHAPTGHAVAFARRPGTFAVAFNIRDARPPVIVTAAPGRHFFGHGTFSRDGRLLYATENDFQAGRGVAGIYDVAAGYKKIGEHPSYGVGPHEIVLLRDGKTLAIANGGLDTAPAAGRENLNTNAMQPSLVFVDCETGELRAKHTLPDALSALSIRHITVDAAGLVWFGAQWEGAQSETPQLIGCASQDREVRLIMPSQPVDLKGYIGSIAASADGTTIAASAPKAGRIVFIDAAAGTVVAHSDLKDACGLAGDTADGFAITSGFGVLRHERAGRAILSQRQLADLAFDNHLRAVRSSAIFRA